MPDSTRRRGRRQPRGGVDSNQLAPRIDQRAAGVALIDGCVSLQKVFEAAVAQTGGSALGADNPRCHGFADPQRIADGQADIAHADPVRITQRQDRKIRRSDLQHGQVAGRIRAYQFCGIGLPVGHFHCDGILLPGGSGRAPICRPYTVCTRGAPGPGELPCPRGRRSHKIAQLRTSLCV